jgi:hypothetical protein
LQVPPDVRQERDHVGVGQEDLERVPGHQHELEAPAELNRARVASVPRDGWVAAASLGEHRVRGIDADEEAAVPLRPRPPQQQSGAAAEVEHGACLLDQVEVVVVAAAPRVERVVQRGQPLVGVGGVDRPDPH